ncbi:hypothetical protein DPMN_148648 [Dreissena polymorpha]|uniref:Uncharacterized protein n=1 Tax=Dreissena polymorpha TaxID=45954 RepID=A0A9D4FCW4_DREPO|nr:hypothetical protein DPMN_148648 [Dreissena polymorpha]
MFKTTAAQLLHRAQYKLVSPEHDSSTCKPTRTIPGDHQSTKAGLVWTSEQTRLYDDDCDPKVGREMSPSRTSKEKLEGQYVRCHHGLATPRSQRQT